jgi:hypothetical protein
MLDRLCRGGRQLTARLRQIEERKPSAGVLVECGQLFSFHFRLDHSLSTAQRYQH